MLRDIGELVQKYLVEHFSKVLYQTRTPETWKNAIVTIIHQTGGILKIK